MSTSNALSLQGAEPATDLTEEQLYQTWRSSVQEHHDKKISRMHNTFSRGTGHLGFNFDDHEKDPWSKDIPTLQLERDKILEYGKRWMEMGKSAHELPSSDGVKEQCAASVSSVINTILNSLYPEARSDYYPEDLAESLLTYMLRSLPFSAGPTYPEVQFDFDIRPAVPGMVYCPDGYNGTLYTGHGKLKAYFRPYSDDGPPPLVFKPYLSGEEAVKAARSYIDVQG